jgi:hypothetical protein
VAAAGEALADMDIEVVLLVADIAVADLGRFVVADIVVADLGQSVVADMGIVVAVVMDRNSR